MVMHKKEMAKTNTHARICRLSELGRCKRRFIPKREWQDFCKPKHQEIYWSTVRKEKRLIVKKIMEHDKDIRAIKRRLGMKG